MKNFIFLQTGRESSEAENKQQLADVQREKGLSLAVGCTEKGSSRDQAVGDKGLSLEKPIGLGNGSRTAREWLENGSTKFRQCFEYCLGWSRLRLNFGSTMARVWKYAAMLLMVLTIGAGEMNAWDAMVCRSTDGGKKATKTVGDKLNGGSEWNYTFTTNGGWSSGELKVLVGISTSYYKSVDGAWVSDDGSTNKNVKGDIGNVVLDRSGNWYAVGKYKTAYTTTNSSWTSNTTLSFGSNSEPYWQVNPPAVKSGTISVSATNTAAGSGTGLSSESPIILTSGSASRLTITATQNVSDANSSLYCKFGSGSYSSTTTYDIAANTLTSNQTLALGVKYYNSSASLSGTESTATIYYKWEEAPAVVLTASKSSGIKVGETITLTATGSYASNITQYEFYEGSTKIATTSAPTNTYSYTPTTVGNKTMKVVMTYNSGSSTVTSANLALSLSTPSVSLAIKAGSSSSFHLGEGSTILKATPSNVGAGVTPSYVFTDQIGGGKGVTSASQTGTEWTYNPTATGQSKTRTMKVTMSVGGGTYTGTVSVNVYERFTIHIKNTDSWSSMYLYMWNGSGNAGAWPGTQQTAYNGSSKWYNVVLDTEYTTFIISQGNDTKKSGDITMLAASNAGNCYTTTTGTSLPSTTCPSAPSVTTATATSVAATSVTFNASSVSDNSDDITAYGFKWGTTSACSSGTVSASNLGTGTTFSATKSSLTNGTTYYFKAYATNAQGTTYGDPVSVRTKFVTTITLNMQGGANGTSEVTATEGSAMPTGKTAPEKSGYAFGGYYANAGGSGTQYYNSSMSSAHNWDVAASTATIHAKWTARNYTITLNKHNGQSNGSISVTFDATTNLTGTAVTAPSKTGYNFGGYWTGEGGSGVKVFNTNGTVVSNASGGGNTYTNSGAWKYPNNITLHAYWIPKTCTINFDFDDEDAGYYADGSTTSVTGTYDSAMPTIAEANLPTAKSGYAFMGYFTAKNGSGTKYYNADGTSAKNWDQNTEEDQTLFADWQKADITSLEHDATVAKDETAYLVVNPVLNVTPANYTDICWTLHYSENDNEVDGAHWEVAEYTESGTKPRQVRFTFTNLAIGSYYVKAVLKASASSGFDPCSTGTTLDTETGEFSIVGSSTVTIRYQYYGTGDNIAANGSVEIPAAGNSDITAPNIIGYTFREWSIGAGVTKNSGALTDATINISSTYDGVVTAFYNKKQMIYFNNTLGWEDVYVYFYNDGSGNEYWASGYGTGANKMQEFSGNKPYWEQEHGHMTQIEGTNIWYFDYKGAGYSTTRTKVAFANKDQNINKSGATNAEAYFHDASVVYRTDYDESHLSMFVPIDAVQYDYTTNTGSKYYHGYWINYPENTGYTLKIFDDTGGGASFVKDQVFAHNANKRMPMSISLELEGGKTYGFKVYRNDGNWYGNSATMKNGSSGDEGQTVWEFTTGTNNCGLTTTSSGIYTFTLSYGQDNYSNYNFLMGVRYPESVGDFRVQYKDDVKSTWKTSSVIPAVTEADTISYFVRKASTPYIRVQKCTAVDGSGNPTWSNENSGNNIISSLPEAITADGVYNFIFSKAGDALVLDKVEPYTGNFYIRVGEDGDNSWDNYRTADHIMPFSEYSFKQTTDPYSHYFTKYYRTMNDNGTPADPSSINITFVVANDYSTNISETITTDDTGNYYVNASGVLSGHNANIRFMYNYKTNVATRRYLDDAQGPRSTDFLLLIPSNSTSIYNAQTAGDAYSQVQLTDKGNWIYEANVYVVPGTTYKVRAKFGADEHLLTQYLKGKASGDGEYETLIGGSGGSRLQIRLIYDFKTNRLVTGYVPSGTIDTNIELNADIMFVREHQGNVTQITFGENKSITEIKNVYTTLKFNKSTITNPGLSRYERDLYYISFPYDVLVSDIIGFGTYGTHWIIEYYDGAGRAEKGFWADSKSFWKFVTPAMKSTYKLKAGTGYIVALDLDEMESTDPVWEHTETVELIFPGNISSISNQEVTYNMPSHQCNIGPRFEGGDDRRIKDSHWNVLGVPAYHNTTGSFANHTDEIGGKEQVWAAENAPKYLYIWNMTDNSLSATNASGYTYKAMHAYMVQYYGDVTFHTSTNAVPASVAARTYAEAPSEVQFRLEIQQNEVAVDQTFVTMSNDGEVSREFVFGEDMSKEFNKNKANIYTIVTSTIEGDATVTEVAGNTLPMSEQTTLVPMGVKVVENADYTFSIPEGTEGVGVTLIDKVADTYTNLSGLDYTVSLEAGTYDDRFVLQISPIQHVATEQSAVSSQQSAVRKVLIDGLLYIVRDGKMFDARGARVE